MNSAPQIQHMGETGSTPATSTIYVHNQCVAKSYVPLAGLCDDLRATSRLSGVFRWPMGAAMLAIAKSVYAVAIDMRATERRRPGSRKGRRVLKLP